MKTILLLLALCVPCLARLGENEKQLTARYGEPAQIIQTPLENMRIWVFRKGPLMIRVGVLDGVSSDESYEPVTAKEADKIMSEMPGEWKGEEAKGDAGKLWRSGTSFALWVPSGMLSVATDAAMKAQKKIDALRAAAKGF